MNGQRKRQNVETHCTGTPELAERNHGQQDYDSSYVQWKRVTAADAAAAAGLRGEVPSNDQAEDSAGLGYPNPIVYYRGI